MQQNQPLCARFTDLLDDGVFATLGLDKTEYYGAFAGLKEYWHKKLPYHGLNYVICAALQLRQILQTPQEWLEVGRYLADATAKTYGRGSHSFVENAVPALIDGGLVHTKDELLKGIDILLIQLHPHQRGEHLFEIIPQRIRDRQITTLDQLASYEFGLV